MRLSDLDHVIEGLEDELLHALDSDGNISAALTLLRRMRENAVEGWATDPSDPERHSEPIYFMESEEVEDGLEHWKEDTVPALLILTPEDS